MYIAYDIKGIQQFIFSVPKLKYIVGGSLLIDAFDRLVSRNKDKIAYQAIFTGGGRGILTCSSGQESEIIQYLVMYAHKYGLDIRIGTNEKFSDAVVGAEDLYPFIPDSLEGEPCRASGLWPVKFEKSCGYKSEGKGIHPKIWERREKIGKSKSDDSFDLRIIKKLIEQASFPEELKGGQFLTTVKSDENMDEHIENQDINAEEKQEILELQQRAKFGSKSLGNRNRWAIVALDGNDMGSQFRAFEASSAEKDEEYKRNWYKTMSKALDACTREAFYHALAKVIAEWWKKEGRLIYSNLSSEQLVVLPFRPLILGGDDVLCLSHPSYAMDLARTLIEKFAKLSKEKAENARTEGIDNLWPGTSNELSISAGIAFTSVTQPLHMAIPYAERLLNSAKKESRKKRQCADEQNPKTPTPAAIDWEHITETMIDTPAARRLRDLTFIDEDLNGVEVHLSKRPYQVASDLEELLKLKEQLKGQLKGQLKRYPRSLLAECLEILRLPWAKRMQRLAAMRKQNCELVDMIKDKELDGELGNQWKIETPKNTSPEEKTKRTTSFLDAVMLLDEEHRMEQETVN